MKTTDETTDVVLIGYENQENLGLRSLQAYLEHRGRRVEVIPFVPGQTDAILRRVRRHQPRIVGISIIFQYALEEFHDLIRLLRENGVAAHFTAGGHFPSIRPELTLALLPELDTVVRFEGEETLTELLETVDARERWPDVRGLAFRDTDKVILTHRRPPVANLDDLPVVHRDELREVGGVKAAFLLASRGCLFNCSFCSVREFYRGAAGPVRRTRSPGAVVREMSALFHERGVQFFSFQDDDFAARTGPQREWLRQFLSELDHAGLTGHVWWKVSCRVDDLEPEILREMKARGLAAVYLGVESGSDAGLRTMNKGVTVAQNRRAIQLVKDHGLALGIGFMLFDPFSTIETTRANIAFLREIGADGYFPVTFCKLLPYAGTPIEERLRQDGRLTGDVAHPNYGFADPQLDWYEALVTQLFSRRNAKSDGIVALLQEADFDGHIGQVSGRPEYAGEYQATLRRIVGHSNQVAVDVLTRLLDALLEQGIDHLVDEQHTLLDISDLEWRAEMRDEIDLRRLQIESGVLRSPR